MNFIFIFILFLFNFTASVYVVFECPFINHTCGRYTGNWVINQDEKSLENVVHYAKTTDGFATLRYHPFANSKDVYESILLTVKLDYYSTAINNTVKIHVQSPGNLPHYLPNTNKSKGDKWKTYEGHFWVETDNLIQIIVSVINRSGFVALSNFRVTSKISPWSSMPKDFPQYITPEPPSVYRRVKRKLSEVSYDFKPGDNLNSKLYDYEFNENDNYAISDHTDSRPNDGFDYNINKDKNNNHSVNDYTNKHASHDKYYGDYYKDVSHSIKDHTDTYHDNRGSYHGLHDELNPNDIIDYGNKHNYNHLADGNEHTLNSKPSNSSHNISNYDHTKLKNSHSHNGYRPIHYDKTHANVHDDYVSHSKYPSGYSNHNEYAYNPYVTNAERFHGYDQHDHRHHVHDHDGEFNGNNYHDKDLYPSSQINVHGYFENSPSYSNYGHHNHPQQYHQSSHHIQPHSHVNIERYGDPIIRNMHAYEIYMNLAHQNFIKKQRNLIQNGHSHNYNHKPHYYNHRNYHHGKNLHTSKYHDHSHSHFH
ncbi:hypothetical protein A3Q56_07012 [Intoshia linei]|uniref:Uncharacterized protein n=1 Tax=Intoshia linei TaxID=1819745 RepID=A0A177ATE4_9BILA|nr:hypothetical protein A3Q56_07012 [Intoshia linei]